MLRAGERPRTRKPRSKPGRCPAGSSAFEVSGAAPKASSPRPDPSLRCSGYPTNLEESPPLRGPPSSAEPPAWGSNPCAPCFGMVAEGHSSLLLSLGHGPGQRPPYAREMVPLRAHRGSFAQERTVHAVSRLLRADAGNGLGARRAPWQTALALPKRATPSPSFASPSPPEARAGW